MRLFSIDLVGSDPEIVSDRCWTAGAAGIWEADDTTWRVGVDDDAVVAFVTAVADLSPVDVTDTEAFELATRDVVVDDIDLSVPPTVFGDGAHATTSGCLEALATVVRSGDRVLDVGCGSGVLSIAAAQAGADVTAVDIDPIAVESTIDNAAANDVTVDASTTPLAAVTGTFDVVVANITADSITPLLADLVRLCRHPGVLIVSGILENQWDDVRADIVGLAGVVPETDVDRRDGWVTATLSLD